MSRKRAETLLSCALTYREATPRTERMTTTFSSVSEAVSTFTDVLMHEAHEAMVDPLSTAPVQPFMHPVDVETDEPGIVDQKKMPQQPSSPSPSSPSSPPLPSTSEEEEKGLHIHRCRSTLPRMVYHRRLTRDDTLSNEDDFSPSPLPPHPSIIDLSPTKASKLAHKTLQQTISRAEKRACGAEERAERARLRKEERANETPEARARRLAEARERREQKRLEKEQSSASSLPASPPSSSPASPSKPPKPTKPPKPPKPPPPPPMDDSIVDMDCGPPLIAPSRKRIKGAKVQFYSHPLPHHRHLEALQRCEPHANLLPALLRGEAVDEVSLIQGPPGTGKTRELVRLIGDVLPPTARIFLCAPTNVGVANLYARCLASGLGHEAALVLAPDRIPPGTEVWSNDPNRRIVCGTVSSRCGPVLASQDFHVVMVDEAAQCMEAWVWGLLRPQVTSLFLAGDVHQLPACVSESGVELHHERSMMERLMKLDYENVTELTTQNRMCPALLEFPNKTFYEDRLKTGPHAPADGSFRLVSLDEGLEESDGTSYVNRHEAAASAQAALDLVEELKDDDVVLLTPYAAQCRLLLATKTKLQVHTIDSFQGRECAGVVLSCVRDGRNGIGFWSDDRRWTVALTRAKRALVVVASRPHQWTGRIMPALLDHHHQEG